MFPGYYFTWWRHQMETLSALLAICAGNSSVPGEFPAQRPVTRGFDVFFDLHPNKRLSKQSWGRWFETPSRLLWRHCNEYKNRFMAIGIPVMITRQLSYLDTTDSRYIVVENNVLLNTKWKQEKLKLCSDCELTKATKAYVDLRGKLWGIHYSEVTMGEMAFQITRLTSVYSNVYSGADQRRHQSSASLAFVREIHRWPVNFPHKCPVTRKIFPFDDIIMFSEIFDDTYREMSTVRCNRNFFTDNTMYVYVCICI